MNVCLLKVISIPFDIWDISRTSLLILYDTYMPKGYIIHIYVGFIGEAPLVSPTHNSQSLILNIRYHDSSSNIPLTGLGGPRSHQKQPQRTQTPWRALCVAHFLYLWSVGLPPQQNIQYENLYILSMQIPEVMWNTKSWPSEQLHIKVSENARSTNYNFNLRLKRLWTFRPSWLYGTGRGRYSTSHSKGNPKFSRVTPWRWGISHCITVTMMLLTASCHLN